MVSRAERFKNNTEISRRNFLKTAGLGIIGLAFSKSFAKTVNLDKSPQRNKPNILVIISDEHNASVLGCYNNHIIQTPHLNRLASKGTVFTSFYTTSPLCVPARLSFTSGKYSSHVRVWNNNCWLESDDYPSLPRLLNKNGYESFLCGKMHYDITRRYGFTEIGTCLNYWNKRGTDRFGRRKPNDLKPQPGHSQRIDTFHTGDTSRVMEHDRKVTKFTTEFIKKRKDREKPFFMVAGYWAPHFPLTVPKSYWKRYQGKVPMPLLPKGHLESQPLNYKHHRIGFNMENLPDDIVRKGRELYYGLVDWLDNEIGKVLKTLENSEIAENTVVIYTSDHGENMGEHGLWFKNCMYEHSVRVPLIITYPKRWKGEQIREKACSHVDLARTIAEIGGVKTPHDWDGDSMVDWLDNHNTNWKDMAVSEYYSHPIASGFVMIRMGKYKYVYHTPPDDNHPPQRELYDLKYDPGEFNNLANQSEYANLLNKMHAALVQELGEEPDITEKRCREDGKKVYEGKSADDPGRYRLNNVW